MIFELEKRKKEAAKMKVELKRKLTMLGSQKIKKSVKESTITKLRIQNALAREQQYNKDK